MPEVVSHLLPVNAKTATEPATPLIEHYYSPEIEERRADYMKLADSLLDMIELSCSRPDGRLDVDKPDLITAIDEHIKSLWGQLDWFDPELLRRFYVELRLTADQQAYNRTNYS